MTQYRSSTLALRNIVVGSKRTSVRLEPAIWVALNEVARQQRRTLRCLVTEIDNQRQESSLTAAIRVYVVEFYRSALTARLRARPTVANSVGALQGFAP